MYILSNETQDWAGQLLTGADPRDVLVAAPDMAPFLAEVDPFIKIHFSRYVQPGAVWRMQDKAAELLLKGIMNHENSSDGG